MGPKSGKLMGPVVYFLHIKGTSGVGKAPLENKLGPFASLEEAEMKKREQEEARGDEGYEYEYRIAPVSTALLQSGLSAKK